MSSRPSVARCGTRYTRCCSRPDYRVRRDRERFHLWKRPCGATAGIQAAITPVRSARSSTLAGTSLSLACFPSRSEGHRPAGWGVGDQAHAHDRAHESRHRDRRTLLERSSPPSISPPRPKGATSVEVSVLRLHRRPARPAYRAPTTPVYWGKDPRVRRAAGPSWFTRPDPPRQMLESYHTATRSRSRSLHIASPSRTRRAHPHTIPFGARYACVRGSVRPRRPGHNSRALALSSC